MSVDTIRKELNEMGFSDTVDVLKASIEQIKTLTNNDIDFKRMLGEIVSLSLPENRSSDKEYKLKQMELIHRFQYNQCSSYEKGLIDLFYKGSEDNRGLLAIAYPFEADAFKKYGRENATYLGMQIEELRKELNQFNDSLERGR